MHIPRSTTSHTQKKFSYKTQTPFIFSLSSSVTNIVLHKVTNSSKRAMASKQNLIVFEDYFPAMMEKLGTEGFMRELASGFQLLVDREKKVITFESLKKNSALLGLEGMSDDEIRCMLIEGDLDGDGALDEMEFCTLMFRLSPALMNNSKQLLEEAIFPFH